MARLEWDYLDDAFPDAVAAAAAADVAIVAVAERGGKPGESVRVPLPARRMPRGGVLSILARVTSTRRRRVEIEKSICPRRRARERTEAAPLLVSLERTTTRHAHRLSIILYS